MAEANSTHTCQACGCVFTRKTCKDGTPRKIPKHLVCSEYCRSLARGINKTLKSKDWVPARIDCVECGTTFVQRCAKQDMFCSKACKVRNWKTSNPDLVSGYGAVRRARKLGTTTDNINPIKVFERDGWRCHICGKKTQRSKRGTCHPDAPELEHIVSLADSGTHTWGNVACSCRSCNRKKGAKSFGQLGFAFPV